MDSAAPRIPQSEWDRWKDTIVDLISNKTLEELMIFMKDENKFIASRSQYQKQLHIWKDRKNLTRDEWVDIFEIQDKLNSQKIESRIFISGRPIPAPKIQRARRNCKDKSRISKSRTIKEGHSAFSRNVSMEILGADGKWTPYVNLENIVNESDKSHNEARGEFSSRNSQAVESNSFGVTGADVGEISDLQIDDGLDHFDKEIISLYQDFPHISSIHDLDMGTIDGELFPLFPSNILPFSPSMAMVQLPSPQEPSDFWVIDNELSGHSVNSPSQMSFTRLFDFQIHAHEMPCDLPFKRFEHHLKAQGAQFLPRYKYPQIFPRPIILETNHMPNISSGIHLTTQSPDTPGLYLAPMVENPARIFLEDVQSSMLEINEYQAGQGHLDAKSLLLSLRSLLSHEDLRGGCHSTQSLITDDGILRTEFNKLLVFSIVNGFAGLQDVPIQSVLKYLSRHGNISSLLLQFLRASQSYAAKALAENLFRAAIEGKDERALKRLLAIGLFDVNTTICIINGEKYTPVERAASLRSLRIVELLLGAKADVNKTFALYSENGGALAKLINGLRRHQEITPEMVEISKFLLKAGAKVHLQLLRRDLRCHELTYRLFFEVSDSDHSELIRDGLLSQIARRLDDWHATDIIKKIFLACEQTKCGRCLSQFRESVDWALVQSAKHGHLKLVQFLLSHSETPHRALSAAIRSRRSDIIDTVFTLRPDVNAPAHDIDYERKEDGRFDFMDNNYYFMNDECLTTPLAEAIGIRDEELIHMIENAGSLKCLDEGRHFQPAIRAALKIGDITYVRKLLDYYPSPHPSEMSIAVFYAIKYDHEEIFFALLAAGASVNFRNRKSNTLFEAMLCRNHHMVREILNAGFSLDLRRRQLLETAEPESVFREAVKWGDESIIQDLRFTFPDTVLVNSELSEALKMDNMVWLEFLLKSGLASKNSLTWCLRTALSKGDAGLVHYLIERGADPADNEICEICAERYPKMLPLLLKQARLRIDYHVVPGFGAGALNAAIKNGPDGFEALKAFLDSKLVDAETLFEIEPSSLFRDFRSPLGLAIKLSRNSNHADFAVIRKLFDYGCDPNGIATISTVFGYQIKQTVLLEAITTKSEDLVELVIGRGALVRPKTMIGLKRTPLQKAVEVGSLELVTLILKAGADVNDKPATRGGATALQLAALGGNCSIALKLLEHGAEIEALPAQVDGRWPLEGAAEHGRLEMIEFLWKLSTTDFNQKHCRRAMELAEDNGYMACRDLIAKLSQASVASTPVLT